MLRCELEKFCHNGANFPNFSKCKSQASDLHRIMYLSSLESEFSFDLEDSKLDFHRPNLTTVNLLLRAVRAIGNISSDDREHLFADKLLLY